MVVEGKSRREGGRHRSSSRGCPSCRLPRTVHPHHRPPPPINHLPSSPPMSSFISASQPVRSASRPTAFRRLSWDGGEDEVFPVSGGSSTSSPSSQDSSVVVHSSSQETINKAKDSQLTPPKSGDENEIKLREWSCSLCSRSSGG